MNYAKVCLRKIEARVRQLMFCGQNNSFQSFLSILPFNKSFLTMATKNTTTETKTKAIKTTETKIKTETKAKVTKSDEETTCRKCKSPVRYCECSVDTREDICFTCGGEQNDCMCAEHTEYCRWCDQDPCECDMNYDDYVEYMAQKDYCYNCGKHYIECKCEDTRQEEKEDKK